jgi:hypothetical protein
MPTATIFVSLTCMRCRLDAKMTRKSCYDPDVDPLYCAWGVDVYKLFVNTKSDIGPNPKLVSQEAQEEFMQLPKHEQQERLGFEAMLFSKLQDLVRMCDRTVLRS